MIKVEPDAAYTKKDLAEIFGKTERTINRYYTQGLPTQAIRGVNYTFGEDVMEWLRSGGQANPQPKANPKLIKFRRANGL